VHPEADAGVTGETVSSPTGQEGEETEGAAFADMRALSLPTLQEYWINEEDAVYDSL